MSEQPKGMATEATKSEFGSGFLYPLALFVAHSMRLGMHLQYYEGMRKSHPDNPDWFTPEHAASITMNGAGDHLFEFDPALAPESLRSRCVSLREEALRLRLDEPASVSEVSDLFDEAKLIFLELDRLNGVEPVRAEWS